MTYLEPMYAKVSTNPYCLNSTHLTHFVTHVPALYTLEFVTFLDTTGTTGHSWFYFNQVSAGIFQEYCAQSNPTLCSPMDCSLPGSSVHGFARQEYWTGCHFLLQGIPVPEIKPASIVSLALVDGFFTTTATWEDPSGVLCLCNLQIWFEEGEYWR